jgi:hypothetical protein
VILWPVGFAVVLVWAVFRDPAVDYRMVVVGALLPDAVDGFFGGARVMHTLAASAAVLVVVMLATRHRRAARRRLIFVPIGMLAHLLADGMWARAATFWWPFSGASLTGDLPVVDHGVVVLVAEEIAGLLALAWCWRRFRLSDPVVRANFARTGRLPRDLVK